MLSFGQKFSPVRGSILMQFRSLESPEFILLAIELSLKAATVWNHNSERSSERPQALREASQ